MQEGVRKMREYNTWESLRNESVEERMYTKWESLPNESVYEMSFNAIEKKMQM